MFSGFPGLSSIMADLPRVAAVLVSYHRKLKNATTDLLREPVPFAGIRAPLDTRRHNVRSVPWQPLSCELETGKQSDMMQLLDLLI